MEVRTLSSVMCSVVAAMTAIGRAAIYETWKVHPKVLQKMIIARLLLSRCVVSMPPGCMHRRLVHLHAHFSVAAVVLRIARIITQDILAA